MPEFEDLPFFERPDLSPYLVHLTKNTRAETHEGKARRIQSAATGDHTAYDFVSGTSRTSKRALSKLGALDVSD